MKARANWVIKVVKSGSWYRIQMRPRWCQMWLKESGLCLSEEQAWEAAKNGRMNTTDEWWFNIVSIVFLGGLLIISIASVFSTYQS